jgi:class 3 adenylate cyclase
LNKLLAKEQNPDTLLKYGNILLQKSLKDSLFSNLYAAHLQIGNSYKLKGNLSQGLENYFIALKYAEKYENIDDKGKVFVAIADTYSANENSQNAIIYYRKSIEILENGNDSIGLGSAIFNAGDEYLNMGKLDSALLFTERSQQIFERVDFPLGKAYCLGNLGMIFAEYGNKSIAEDRINQAIEILEKYADHYAIAVYLNFMSSIYLEKSEDATALSYSQRSLDLAKKYGLKEQISESNLLLSKIYEQSGNAPKALEFYKQYILYRDSVNNIQAVQEIANLRTDYEVSQKQVEVDSLEKEALISQLREKRQQFFIYAVLVVLLFVILVAIMTYRRYRFEKETKLIIEKEKNRSEELLLNILPEETAEELKNDGKVMAKRIDSVTVLFTDFKSFTAISENISPEKLVESIDFYFKEFDRITTKYGLEKIKTIGDSYMCAGGLPIQNKTHPTDVILAAKEMMAFVNQELSNDLMHFEMRIGIHTGPIVAGIVGIKKWQYDIWGDTVNIASRMETNSVEGKINLSETTYELIKDEFECEYRGSIDVKNRGIWKMYFLK